MAEEIAPLRPDPSDPLRSATPPTDDVEARRARAAIEAQLFGDIPVPVRVGRYEVQSRLGAGGMGVVYRAHDPDLARDVAVKLMNPEAAHGTRAETSQARLVREARAMARLAHPNVISVYDVGTVEDGVFIAMELVEGCDLATWLGLEPRPWQDILQVCVDAGNGLAAAHRASVVHRDFKPENVLVGQEGRVRVVDFGLAGGPAAESDPEPSSEDSDEIAVDMSLTKTGAMLGTPKYMAPEQYEAAAQTTARGDQFSFCVTVYEALYGRAPFEGETVYAYRENVTGGNVVPPPADSPVPRRVFDVLARGLAVNPANRHANMDALLAELRRTLAGRGRRRRIGGLITGAAAVALASLGLGLWLGDEEAPVVENTPAAVVQPPVTPVSEPTPAPEPEPDSEPAGEPTPEAEVEPEAEPAPPEQAPTPEAPYAVCYYTEDRGLLLEQSKRKSRRRHAIRGDRGICYKCARKVSRSRLPALLKSSQCESHYYCTEADDAKCGS